MFLIECCAQELATIMGGDDSLGDWDAGNKAGKLSTRIYKI
jgi:hypothetical protein